MFKLLVRLLDDDDRRVHHCADGDGDSAEAHDVGGHAHPVHRDERDDDCDRDGDDRNERRRDVPEEDHDHDADDDDLLNQRPLERLDGAVDQLSAVVSRHDLHARRQRRLHLIELRPHPFDHLPGILAVAHDDYRADDFTLAIKLTDAATDVGAKRDSAEVFYQHRRAALFACAHHDVPDIIKLFDVTPPSHHVFAA